MEQTEAGETIKSGRIKMSGKTAQESHREYLDMDTDEEEFGRQETPESLDEAPPEPDKPEFTSEELDTLVKHTKALTILPNLLDTSWNDKCLETVRDYFREPANPLLCVFFDNGELQALLGFPERTDAGLVYFLREPWQVYRPDDFLASVTFGSVNARPELAILKIVAGFYAPLVFKHDDWPEIMRDEIFSNTHGFLERATELAYQPSGMLILYTPWEGIQARGLDSNAAKERRREEQLIGRLEMIARTWVKKIREVLTISIVTNDHRLYDLACEYDFWRGRYDNLVGVARQLENKRVVRVLRQLGRLGSSSVKEVKSLGARVSRCLEQAESNLAFLDLVLEQCQALEDPNTALDSITRILLGIRFAWTESAYYNEPENVERLLCALSVQIVKTSARGVDLQAMFDEPKRCRAALRTSWRRCASYCAIYDDVIGKCLAEEDKWRTRRSAVFASVAAYQQRCLDVVEICDAIIVYGSLDEVNLGGTRGDQHGLQFARVKEYFNEIMMEMRIACGYALDIKRSQWFEDMTKFRRDVARLENTMKNLMGSLFEDVRDVEMGIETLYTILKFKDRRDFRDILHDKWMQVWNLFYDEIRSCSLDKVEYEIVQDKMKAMESESSLLPFIQKKYLATLHKIMIDASDWLGDCDIQNEILKYLKIK